MERRMFGYFRESSPRPEGIPDHLYTMEIFHGGYFENQMDGTMKYKVPRYNKTGGKIFLDELDPEKISWVELNNIAYDLGYRELPISYHFRPANMKFVQINSDGDAVEMVNSMGPKKRVSVYITRGGRRKFNDALADFEKPVDEQQGDGISTSAIGAETTRKRVRQKVQRKSIPPAAKSTKEQVVRSNKGWKKMKLVMGGASDGNGGVSTHPPTQFSQNPAAKSASS